MLFARLHSPAFQSDRIALAKYLTHIRARFGTRVMHNAQSAGMLPGNAHRLLDEFCDLAFEAIRTDFYRPLQIWCTMHADVSQVLQARTAFVLAACSTLDSECELALPHFAPLLGDIRFAINRLTRAISVRNSDSAAALAHDALEIALDEALMTMDARDAGLGEQARIVGDWAARIAHSLSADEHFVLHVQRAAMLADIGKITTPRHILHATRPRSIAENIVFEQHALAGWEIILHIPALAAFADVARAHHECVDGSGFPDGLLGSEIPYAAQIVAVADGFASAMRASPGEWTNVLQAFEMVNDVSGIRYEPQVVSALQAVLAADAQDEAHDDSRQA